MSQFLGTNRQSKSHQMELQNFGNHIQMIFLPLWVLCGGSVWELFSRGFWAWILCGCFVQNADMFRICDVSIEII